MLGRKDYAFIGRKHGFSRLDVCYHDGSGQKRSAAIDWHLTAAPLGDTVLIRHADSGMIRAAPARVAEVMWFEVWAIMGGLLFGVFALIALSVAKVRKGRKSHRSSAGNPFTKPDEPDRQA